MSKIIKRIRIIVFLLILFGINSCTKDELSSKDNNFSIQKQQKFNPDEGYPFVLTEADAPFQFAVYQQDEDILFSYIESILEEQDGMENPGYFILSLNSEDAHFYYGFITETSSYYDPTWINPDVPIDTNEGGGGMCFGWIIVGSHYSQDFNETQAWAHEQMDKGYTVSINYHKETNEYVAIAKKWVD